MRSDTPKLHLMRALFTRAVLTGAHRTWRQNRQAVHAAAWATVLACLNGTGHAATGAADEELTVEAAAISTEWLTATLLNARIVEQPALHEDLNAALTGVPGVDLSGQGGYLRSVSLRGLSGWRVQHRVAGIPIFSERRAGSALSFVPALFTDTIAVLPSGAAAQSYQSALSGIIDVQLSTPQELSGMLDLELTQGHGRGGVLLGNQRWYGGYYAESRRDAAAPDQQRLNSAFEQHAAFVGSRWIKRGPRSWRALMMNTYVHDAGKSNSDFPNRRITQYPREQHWLGKVQMAQGAWTHTLWWHDTQLITRINSLATSDTPTAVETAAANQSTNYGWGSQRDWQAGAWQGQFGGNALLRDRIRLREQQRVGELNPDTAEVQPFTTERSIPLNGSTRELAAHASAWRSFNRWQVASSLRFAQQRNAQDGSRRRRTGANWQLGLARTLGGSQDNTTLSFNFSSGARLPNLVETFNNARTPRGRVLGNPGLERERLNQLELALEQQNPHYGWALQAYRMWGENFISRERLSDDVLQYVSVGGADLWGLEASAHWQHADGARLEASWQQGRATAQDGSTLAGAPAAALRVRAHYPLTRGHLTLEWQHRRQRNRFASQLEQALDSANKVNLRIETRVADRWRMAIWVDNALDDQHLESSDQRAAFAPGRELGLTLTYKRRRPAR